jgi:hypothetical protein
MTGPSAPTVICRQCGTVNNAEDQFCGNCGAFLEWTAEPADAAATPVSAAPAGSDAAATAAPGPTAPTSAAAASATDELVRCPSCGTANVAGRTFCQRCGNKLAGATAAVRLPLPPRSEAGAAAAASGPAVAPVRQPVAGRTSTARRREAADTRGGLPGWLMVVVAGIVVGAIVVALVLVLGAGGAKPPTAASSAPSASAGASAGPSASHRASAPAKTPKPTVKPKPSKK